MTLCVVGFFAFTFLFISDKTVVFDSTSLKPNRAKISKMYVFITEN